MPNEILQLIIQTINTIQYLIQYLTLYKASILNNKPFKITFKGRIKV